MQQESKDPVIFCQAPRALNAGKRQPILGILSKYIVTVGDLRKHVRNRTGVAESEQLFINAYVDDNRLERLDSKDDTYVIKHESLPNPLRLQSKGIWPRAATTAKSASEKLKWWLRNRMFDDELQKHYTQEFGTSKYLPMFVMRAQQRQNSGCAEASEEEAARAKILLYQYLLQNEADGKPGQLFLEILVEMIKASATEERADLVDLFAERTDIMIDSMNGTDASKLSYIFETVSQQTAIQTASVYLQVSSAFSESGGNTTFRDLLRATKGITADVWCDQHMIDQLEDLVREPDLHARKIINVIKEHQGDGDLWYTRCATTILPCIVTHLGDVPLASQEEVKIRLDHKPDSVGELCSSMSQIRLDSLAGSKEEVKRRLDDKLESPSELCKQMLQMLKPRLDSLGGKESWACMDIVHNCDNQFNIMTSDLLKMGMAIHMYMGESSEDLVMVMIQTMQLHNKKSVRPGLRAVATMFGILAAKHGQTFSVATQLRSFKIMYQNALCKKLVQE